jgi:hypothetical protein
VIRRVVKKTHDAGVNMCANFMFVVPGSDLHDEAIKKEIPLPTETLTMADVLWFRDYVFFVYFRNLRYLAMIEIKFALKARTYVEAMTQIRLKRKFLGN